MVSVIVLLLNKKTRNDLFRVFVKYTLNKTRNVIKCNLQRL